MRGFDVDRFLKERSATWEELEATLARIEQKGIRALGVDGARRFAVLYRGVSSDLLRARTEMLDANVTDYLNALVARAYAHVYSQRVSPIRKITRFLASEFPRLVRAEWRLMFLSAAVFFGGAPLGAVAVAVDPTSLAVVIPDGHQERTPEERVEEDEATGGNRSGSTAASFSSFLFTHNIQVTFLVFALGITFGIGTLYVLFANGLPIGALAMQYHASGKALFFWAWILPHGIPEITVVIIAGAAGLVIARGLVLPGQLARKDALLKEAKRAVMLVLGGMPLLVLAGVIEGTISQMHAPIMPYWAKLAVAGIVGSGVYAYLLFAGRGDEGAR